MHVLWGSESFDGGVGNRSIVSKVPYAVELPFIEMEYSLPIRFDVDSEIGIIRVGDGNVLEEKTDMGGICVL